MGPSPLQSLQDDRVGPLSVEPYRALGVSHWEGGEGHFRYPERWLPLIALPCNGRAEEGTTGDTSAFLLVVIGSTGMSPDLHHHEAGSDLEDCQFLTHLLRAPDLLCLGCANPSPRYQGEQNHRDDHNNPQVSLGQ